MAPRGKYVAVALLPRSELEGIGNALRFSVPIDKASDDFSDLLAKIDEADQGPEAPAAAE